MSTPPHTHTHTPGADPGFLKGGGSILGLQAKKGGGVQEGVQLWAQC